MKPEITYLHSPDVYDLAAYVPAEPDNFGFLLQILVGPPGTNGGESFDVVVCTPRWIANEVSRQGILIGRHYLFMDHYDYHRLKAFVENYCDGCTGSTWAEVTDKLGRLGFWEFEDYKP